MTTTKYTISGAARKIGMNRSTVARHIKDRKLSYELDANGNKVIDASELIRVYPDRYKVGETTDSSAAEKAEMSAQEKWNRHYETENTYLKDALKKALDNGAMVTKLIENHTEKKQEQWQKSFDAMRDQIADHKKELKQLKHLLYQERKKSWWQKLVG